jgi:hypothetical protein
MYANKMPPEDEFFYFLLEQYASHKGVNGRDVLDLWDENNITRYIKNMYWRYHTERLENAYEDIDHLITFGRPSFVDDPNWTLDKYYQNLEELPDRSLQ